jgi:hypothetical protein
MLHSELEFYLKTQYSKPTIDFVWSNDDSDKLLSHIYKKFTKDILQETQNHLKIKHAFKEYFEPVGYILFKISEDKIRLKVFPYKIKPHESVNLPSVIEILNTNEKLIEYCYKGISNQISISKELKDKIYHFVNNINNEEINKKELVRFAVSKFFDLQNYDIVVIKDDHIFIKTLDNGYKRKVSEDEKNTIANRYNGINEEELKSLYENFFSNNDNKNFFYYVAKIFVQIYLIDEKIDNHTYEKKRFSYIQSILSQQMSNSYNYDNDFCLGFSGYIFRIHFVEVFDHITSLILEHISTSNEHVISFLKYYSSNVIVIDGKKYKVPEIESENGLRWNVASMLSIVKIYVKTKNSIEKSKKDITEINKNIEALCINNLSPMDYQDYLTEKQEKIEEKIVKDQKRVERLSDSLYLAKNDEKKSLLQKEIMEVKEQIQEKKEEKKKFKAKTVKKSVISQYNNLKRDLDSTVRRLHKEEKILAQNEESYLLIKNALTKALTAKKTLIG